MLLENKKIKCLSALNRIPILRSHSKFIFNNFLALILKIMNNNYYDPSYSSDKLIIF